MVERAVIDSNMLQSKALRDFFTASPSHFAVLPDYLWFEIYKQGSIEAIACAFSIIREFPDRLLGLRSSSELALLDPRCPDLVEQMLYPDMPHLMELTYEALTQAQQGDGYVLDQLNNQWSRSAAHLDETMKGALGILESLPEIGEIFTADEVRRCRTRASYTSEMSGKIFGAADQLYDYFIDEIPYTAGHVSGEHYYDAYLYRLALSIVIYSLWWIEKGSQLPKRIDRFRNDMIDLHFAVYATYFDGFLTDDAKAHWMYSNLFGALRALGARHCR